MNELDKWAEEYMRSVIKGNHGDVFSRSALYEYIIEAYKQGYIDRDTEDMDMSFETSAEFFGDE